MPGAACERCGSKWKTWNKDATEGQKDKLFAAVVEHAQQESEGPIEESHILAFKQAVFPQQRTLSDAFNSPPPCNSLGNVDYYETTPEEGFENAKVIE